MRFPRTIANTAGCLALVTACATGCHRSSVYPNRPIVLICPWSAGGGTDLVSREVAVLLEQELHVPVNVVNATGGAGVTGHTRGALARPDGYTLTMITVELNMLHWRGLTSISFKDFKPLVELNRDAAALFVRSDAPWKTLKEFADHIRQNRGKVNASGTALGGIWHLALAGWLSAIGLQPSDANWISINGAAPSLQELIAGGVEVVCASLPEAKPLMESGRIRCLGVMAETRADQFPDIPTFKEQGKDWSMGGWRGVALPARTPDAVARKVSAALEKVVKGDEYRKFMRNAGFNWGFEGPEEFAASLEKMDQQFGAILNSPAFKALGKHSLGAMFFPALLAVAGVFVLAVLVVTRELRWHFTAEELSRSSLIRMAEVLLWIVAYLIFAESAGFVLTSGVLLMLLMWRLGVRWPAAAIISSVLVPLVYQVFAVYLRVPLPQGVLGW